MNAPSERNEVDQKAVGIYQKFNVTRTDGKDAPGGKHFGDEYFVLNLTTDKHALRALDAYADSCAEEYPVLATDLCELIGKRAIAANEFITVPEITLPNGIIVPSFQVGKYATAEGLAGMPEITTEHAPWVRINFQEAKEAAARAGYKVLTETQALAIAHDIVQQDINWTGGKVGEGKVYMGIHKGDVGEGQPGTYESDDAEERRWHQLSNGERIYDFAGNVYSWIFDDVQGDEKGLTTKIAVDSPSLTTAPFPSMEKGMGWRPNSEVNWSGDALIRGGCWNSEGYAGVFNLNVGWPVSDYSLVGFRCTKSL
jgi:formylglycine-generating enzyme required for sulfatase activity